MDCTQAGLRSSGAHFLSEIGQLSYKAPINPFVCRVRLDGRAIAFRVRRHLRSDQSWLNVLLVI